MSFKKLISSVLVVIIAVSLTGCSLPGMGFAEYDVSGYIRALLDSSYQQNYDEFVSFTGIPEEEAEQNNIATIENGAIDFCNSFDIYPTEEQMTKIRTLMEKVYKLAQYTVKDEEKIESGYTVEVDVTPLSCFNSKASEFNEAKAAAQKKADDLYMEKIPGSSEEELYDEEETNEENESSSENSDTITGNENTTINVNTIYVDMIIEICEKALENPEYGENVTIYLDIIQDNQGNLKLDTNQIGVIDKSIVIFPQ